MSREPIHDLVENSGMIPLLREMAENAIDDPVDLIVFQDVIGIARRRLLSLLLGMHMSDGPCDAPCFALRRHTQMTASRTTTPTTAPIMIGKGGKTASSYIFTSGY